MVSRMGATGRPRSNAVGVCRARASYQRAQQRRRQRAIGLKNAVEGQRDDLFKRQPFRSRPSRQAPKLPEAEVGSTFLRLFFAPDLRDWGWSFPGTRNVPLFAVA